MPVAHLLSPRWSVGSGEEERGTHSRFSFTMEECKAGLLWEERSLQAKTNGFGSGPYENVQSSLTIS